jgi:hypothetical protein
MTLYDGAASATYETEVGPQLVHTYSITNKGPSSITEAEAYFVWPSFTYDGMYQCTVFCLSGDFKIKCKEIIFESKDIKACVLPLYSYISC